MPASYAGMRDVLLRPNSITLASRRPADLGANLRVRVVCVSQAGRRKLVESQLRTGL